MSFLQSLTSAVSNVGDIVRQATGSAPKSPYEVQDISLQQITRCRPICAEDCVKLHKEGNVYFVTLHVPTVSPKAFSLFRVTSESEAMTTFSNFSYKLQPLYLAAPRILNRELLQQFSDSLRANPTWSCAHLAAKLCLTESFRHPLVAQHLNTRDEMTQASPIQVAIQAGNLESIQELIISGVAINLADADGNNVFHYAARTTDPTIIQYLASKDGSVINQLNLFGESALHEACCSGQPHNVEQLLRWGADPNLSMSGRYAIHCAMKSQSAVCSEVLCRWSHDQIHKADGKHGGTPLHWARSKECVDALADLGVNLDAASHTGDTALHIMIQHGRKDSLMALLSRGVGTECRGAGGNTALHMAIQTDDPDLVKTLIVFGTDVNEANEAKITPRHLAATSNKHNRDYILFLLHKVGSLRCPTGRPGCMPGCVAGGSHDGVPRGKVPSTPEYQKKFYDDVVTDVGMAAAVTRSASASGSSIMGGDSMDCAMGSSGDRVLCLDGGGIRGLVLIQVLMAIEKTAGQPIRSCFDWIGGTSTGGILALALVHGKSVRYCQGLYFRLKDEVFCGKRPYDSLPLERFLKKEFGENTRMTEKDYPRVLVTAVLGDRNPAELHIFRNYDPPGVDYKRETSKAMFEPPPRPNEQFVWRAARCSGAAPTYFRTFGRFLDGGLIANNPTLDVMTEIHEYNMGLRAIGEAGMVRPIHVVVSLGTGRLPTRPINAVDVYRPEGLFDIAKVAMGAKNLGSLLIEQCTQSEGQPVERARAWCSMIGVPYFRFSPQLSEDVMLDCKDNTTLINMLWETQCYLHNNQDKVARLAGLLQP